MAKKYYWLKLHKDFFKRHDIRIIEDMPNGKDYVLFYLKLLVESISHEGNLRFSETIPYDEQMLSTITNTNIDIVRSAVKIFTELKLMECYEDGTIFMGEVQKMIGSETEWAEKKRNYRASQKLLEQGQKKTLSDKSKRQSKSKEKDIEVVPEQQQLWTRIQNSWLKARMNVMSRMAQETLQSYLDDGMCVECIEYAIQQADANNARTLTYIKSILNRLVNNHITTPEALQADIQAKSATGRRKDSSVNEGVLSHGYTENDYNDILNNMEEV